MDVAPKSEDRVVIVTGGTRGIGQGIARSFLQSGCVVVICSRTEPEAPLREGDNTAVFVQADVRDVASIEQMTDYCVERWGRIDVLINNAGGSPFADAATASPRFSQAIIELNLIAPLNCAQAVHKIMQRQEGGGVIVNIASVSGVRPSPGTAAYGAAKAGLINLTKSLAIEWAPNVRVNAVAPGLIRTEQSHLHYGDEQGVERVAKTVPAQRLGSPDDVGALCVFLASDDASYISGAVVQIDGGGETPAFLSAARAASGE